MANGQKKRNGLARLFLKGMVDDIRLHHYGVSDTYREFGDAVYVMVPATAICSMQTMAPTPRAANCAPA